MLGFEDVGLIEQIPDLARFWPCSPPEQLHEASKIPKINGYVNSLILWIGRKLAYILH